MGLYDIIKFKGDRMKYNKQLIIDNINYLVQYDYEPEITILLNNNEEIFLIAYQDYVDVTLPSNEEMRLSTIDDLFHYIDISNVVEIQGDIDYQFPVKTQSIINENELWLDAELPKNVFDKYKKRFLFFIWAMIGCFIVLSIYVISTVLKVDKFDITVIIVCSIFVIFCGGVMLTSIYFDRKRKKIIQKYYGVVSEEDQFIANELLSNIHIIVGGYDFYDLFRVDEEEIIIKNCLKRIRKGRKVYIGLSEVIMAINKEIKTNNTDDKYNNVEYNQYIEDFCDVVERNSVAI